MAPPLPPRFHPEEATPAWLAAAGEAVTALGGPLSGPSWRRAQSLRRALLAIAGSDGSQPPLGPALDRLMARVGKGPGRLPLRAALELLVPLDAAAFLRAPPLWEQGGAEGAAALRAQLAALQDPDLTLRLGLLRSERPGRGGSEAGFRRRWQALADAGAEEAICGRSPDGEMSNPGVVANERQRPAGTGFRESAMSMSRAAPAPPYARRPPRRGPSGRCRGGLPVRWRSAARRAARRG